MKGVWWKALAVILVLYTIVAGLLLEVPRLSILNETIRNLHFHVPMWFGMIIILTASVVFSIRYLRSNNIDFDMKSVELAKAGILFCVLGLLTGMLWAKYTWGEWWSGDPKQNGAAICLLIYLAYLVLRNSIQDENQRARISSIYSIFAYAAMIPLLYILPRLAESSLHPGNGGNPALNFFDSDDKLKIVLYPAVIGWTLMGVWLAELRLRHARIKRALEN